MKDLSQVLVEFAEVSREELSLYHYSHPELSIIEAAFRCAGDKEGFRILKAVERATGTPLASERDLFSAEEEIFVNGGPELQRLIHRLKAIPFALETTAPDKPPVKTIVKLAMTDPCDLYTRGVFAGFFNAEIKAHLVREVDLQNALRYKFATSPNLSDASGRFQTTEAEESALDGDPARAAVISLLVEAIKCKTARIEIECKKTGCGALMFNSQDSATAHRLAISAEALVNVLIANGTAKKGTDTVVEGTSVFCYQSKFISLDFAYHRTYVSKSATKLFTLVIKNIAVYGKRLPLFWQSQPASDVTAFEELIQEQPGIYILAANDAAHYRALVTVLLRRWPDLLTVTNPGAITSDAFFEKRVPYARYLLPVKAAEVHQTIAALEKLPEVVRKNMAAVFALTEVPRSCELCTTDCIPSEKVKSLVPPAFSSRATVLKYPRRCPVCANSGYAGTVGLFSLFSMKSAAGKKLVAGRPGNEILDELRKASFRPLSATALEVAFSGKTTIEAVVRTMGGRTDIPLEETYAKGKKLATEARGGDAPVTSSVLFSDDNVKKRSGTFHSVVLTLGDDVLAARDALLAEEGARSSKDEWRAPDERGEASAAKAANAAQNADELPGQPDGAQQAKKRPTGHKYHSVVLDMDPALAEMREKLAEDDLASDKKAEDKKTG